MTSIPKKAPDTACPKCGNTRLMWVSWLIKPFERWSCECGATGRRSGSRLEEVPPRKLGQQMRRNRAPNKEAAP